MRPVAGIVRPRRHLVDQQRAVAVHEHLDAPAARRGRAPRRCAARCASACGGDAPAHAAPARWWSSRMWLPWRFSTGAIDRHRAVHAARDDDRDLAARRGRRPRGSQPPAHARPRPRPASVSGVEQHLALAVIAEARRSSAPPAGRARRTRRVQRLAATRTAQIRATSARRSRCRKAFSAQPVLADAQHLRAPGRAGTQRRQGVRASPPGTFSNSKVTTSTAAAKRGERRRVVIGGDGGRRGDLHRRACPPPARRHGSGSRAAPRPAPSCGRAGRRRGCRWCCPAADRPGRRRDSLHRRVVRAHRGTVGASAPLRSARAPARRSAWRARRRRAPGWRRRAAPALIAPAWPMASVPTGMPAGIWTIDSRLSMPFSAWLSTGTPSTGSGGHRRGHARQVRRAAGAGDDHLAGRGRRAGSA